MNTTALTDNRYLRYVAYCQSIGIILVVLRHSLHEYPDSNHGTDLLVWKLIASFTMPLFMFISGFLMSPALSRKTIGEFVWSKTKRLLIPFVVLTVATFVPRALLSAMADDVVSLDWRAFGEAFVEPRAMAPRYLWFLQADFILLVTTFAIYLGCRNLHIPQWLPDIALLAVALVLNFGKFLPSAFSLAEVANFAPYFVLGIMYAHWRTAVDRLVRWSSPVVAVLLTALWLALFYWCYATELEILCSVAGICMTISIAKLLEKSDKCILDRMSGANYLIFILSWYFNVLSQQVLAHFVALPWYVHTALSLTTGVLVPLWFYLLMQRWQHRTPVKIAALLLGQTFKHPTPTAERNLSARN